MNKLITECLKKLNNIKFGLSLEPIKSYPVCIYNFDKKCINRWFKKDCPMCRTKLINYLN